MFVAGTCLLFRESGESLGTHWCQMVVEADGHVWGQVEIDAATNDAFDRWFDMSRLMITMPQPEVRPGTEWEVGSRALLELASNVARVNEQMRDQPVAVLCRALTQRPGEPIHLLVSSDTSEHPVDEL